MEANDFPFHLWVFCEKEVRAYLPRLFGKAYSFSPQTIFVGTLYHIYVHVSAL